MRVQVQCYEAAKGSERPIRFRLAEHEYLVQEVVDQWYGPDHVFFKVRANDENLYILRHRTSLPEQDWELVSFRQVNRTESL